MLTQLYSDLKPKTIPTRLEGIPDELQLIPNWVCWRWILRGEKQLFMALARLDCFCSISS